RRRQSQRGAQDGHDAERSVRHRIELHGAHRGARMSAAQVMPEPALGPPLLEAIEVTKVFGMNTVLDTASLRLEPGSVHALLGENGAGKSTLVKCIMGFYHADGGRVVVGNSAVHIKNPKDAQQHGIGMVYQHFTLVENMTVAENLVLSRAHVPGLIDWNEEHAALDAFMQTMPFAISPTRLV